MFFTFPTLLAYIIAAVVLPRRPADLYATPEEAAFWRSVRLEPSRTARDLVHKFQELERRLRPPRHGSPRASSSSAASSVSWRAERGGRDDRRDRR